MDAHDPNLYKLLGAAYKILIWPVWIVMGWLFWDMRRFKRDVYETQQHAQDTYVKKEQYDKDINRLFHELDKLNTNQMRTLEKLGEKQDR